MFNRTVVVVPRRPSTINHYTTEKRAPTDESVRLLREIEEAAEKRVRDGIKVGNSAFECVIHVMRDGPSGDTIIMATFSVNGKKCEVKVRGSDHNTTREQRLKMLVDAVAERIAVEIIAPCLRSMVSRI